MKNIYHKQLKLPIDFSVTDLNDIKKIQYYDDKHPALEKLLLSCNISIHDAYRFYTPEHGTLPAHVDCDHENNYAKLNYVFGGQSSRMIWHRLRPGFQAHKMLTPVGSKYLYAPAEQLETVFSAEIGFPSLVNTGQFHSIVNYDQPRVCYSFMLTYAEDPTRNLDWDHAVERLKNFIVVDQP